MLKLEEKFKTVTKQELSFHRISFSMYKFPNLTNNSGFQIHHNDSGYHFSSVCLRKERVEAGVRGVGVRFKVRQGSIGADAMF